MHMKTYADVHDPNMMNMNMPELMNMKAYQQIPKFMNLETYKKIHNENMIRDDKPSYNRYSPG